MEYDELKEKSDLINSILLVCVASDISSGGKCPTTGELFFGLAALSIPELKKICQELYIKI